MRLLLLGISISLFGIAFIFAIGTEFGFFISAFGLIVSLFGWKYGD